MKIHILGKNGKMARGITEQAKQFSDIEIVDDVNQKPVMIDFTHPDALIAHLEQAVKADCALLIGTTGLKTEHHQAIERAARKIPILLAPNTSIGANLLARLVEITAQTLPDAHIGITDIHHQHKIDAPSGTAHMLAKHAAQTRPPGEIPIASLRVGNLKGVHTVYFLSDNEVLELKHEVSDRSVFAQGAIKAAYFLVKQGPGLYTMANVLKI